MVKTESSIKMNYATFTPAQVRGMLTDALRGLGMVPEVLTGRDAILAGEKLAAAVNQPKPWGRSYVLAVLHGSPTVKPSPLFIQAILSLGATLDGVPAIVAAAHEARVLVVGEVVPGALVLANSRPCQRPGCPVQFVPDHPSRRYCCPDCRRKDRGRKK